MAAGKERPGKYDLSSLRLLVNTGEPLKPEIIYWCMEHLGVPVHDAWCSEETGFQLICDFPGQPIKPGSMGRSVPGVQVEILDFLGRPLGPNAIGYLAVKRPWPAMPIQIYGHQEITPDKSMFKSWFVPGDLAYKDEDGYIWFQGKADVSSGLLNASEAFTIERKLAEHPSVEEACIAAAPGTQGQPMVKAFVSLAEEYAWTPRLQNELRLFLRENLPHCKLPDEFEVRSSLPMTRSGKIMRKVLSGSNKEDLVQVGF